MIVIKTDDELRMERKELVEERRRLNCIQQGLIDDRTNLKQIWRATKDPVMKRTIHHEIYKLNDEIMFGVVARSIEDLDFRIRDIDRMLYSQPSPQYGCIYDTYHELDCNKILNYGVIHGVKL